LRDAANQGGSEIPTACTTHVAACGHDASVAAAAGAEATGDDADADADAGAPDTSVATGDDRMRWSPAAGDRPPPACSDSAPLATRTLVALGTALGDGTDTGTDANEMAAFPPTMDCSGAACAWEEGLWRAGEAAAEDTE